MVQLVFRRYDIFFSIINIRRCRPPNLQNGFRVFYHTETDSLRIVGKVDTQVAAQKGWVYDPAGFFVEHKLDSVKLKRHRSTRRLMEVLYRSQRQVVQEARNESFLGWFRREVGKLEPWRNRDGSLSEEYLTAVPWYFRGKQGGATPVDLAAVYAHEAGWIPDGYPDTFLCALEDAVREAGVTLVREDFTDQAVLLTSAMESVDIDSNGSDTVRTDKGDGLDPLPF